MERLGWELDREICKLENESKHNYSKVCFTGPFLVFNTTDRKLDFLCCCDYDYISWVHVAKEC